MVYHLDKPLRLPAIVKSGQSSEAKLKGKGVPETW
jgi:hypothetical protein